MYKVIAMTDCSQDGNHGPVVTDVYEGFATEEDAQKFINEKHFSAWTTCRIELDAPKKTKGHLLYQVYE